MTTYRLSARNQFRTPSGAVGEAPDGPGGMAALSDDLDNRLGVGGAEYCATVAALQAIPSARLYVGKLAYVAATDITYRYVGAGNVAATDAPSTASWQAFDKPPTAYVPAVANLNWNGFTSRTAFWGISAGMFWSSVAWIQSSALTPSTTSDVAWTLGGTAIAGHGEGKGHYNPGGSTAAGNQIPIAVTLIGTFGASTTSARLRALTTGGRENVLGSVVPTGAAGDVLVASVSGPSGSYL